MVSVSVSSLMVVASMSLPRARVLVDARLAATNLRTVHLDDDLAGLLVVRTEVVAVVASVEARETHALGLLGARRLDGVARLTLVEHDDLVGLLGRLDALLGHRFLLWILRARLDACHHSSYVHATAWLGSAGLGSTGLGLAEHALAS